ncbi:hypothetical protein J7384_03900 [Endozoicomonas sp. G2_1]|uniref:hypothetical protein n=1 Tax=Endozoicomonas sp. G2_1 TaxID=2821091 RepID=UPI001ADC624D|nr:hypothetical protein [Endozoicomonas sp. G2_1]MBO9489500.1 hypothetical protein [Endozoicomonas sp. G2_1]
MNTKVTISLVSFLGLLFSNIALGLQSNDSDKAKKESVERITVYGQKSLYQLKKDINARSKDFFKDYNKYNDNNQFAMVCKKEKRSGSSFKATTCEPRFVRNGRAKLTTAGIFGNDPNTLNGVDLNSDGGGSRGSTPPLAMARIAMMSRSSVITASQNKRFEKHVEKLLKENPELLGQYRDILELQAAYAQKKANK